MKTKVKSLKPTRPIQVFLPVPSIPSAQDGYHLREEATLENKWPGSGLHPTVMQPLSFLQQNNACWHSVFGDVSLGFSTFVSITCCKAWLCKQHRPEAIEQQRCNYCRYPVDSQHTTVQGRLADKMPENPAIHTTSSCSTGVRSHKHWSPPGKAGGSYPGTFKWSQSNVFPTQVLQFSKTTNGGGGNNKNIPTALQL